MTRTHVVVDSPIGPMTVVADGETVVGIYMDDARHLPPAERFGPADDGTSVVLKEADRQLGEYFACERTTFDLPLAADGTPFQRRVWAALCEIPYGETISYGELARRIGQPTASRAVGLANGRNPISVVVPCHRVIGSSGKLVGYGGGLSRKQTLLELEQGRNRLL
ncbi:methylated-DNA--[protein]-cysteine S-methyltransferase [Sporichthya brevicatena]|uniref:Methylated-DNA--protein-cysteine methyltransferase n=1 Tax=Sporichthya brevicatena TaxID=171442 RepID=A0ABN1GLU5_9ACTN